MDAITAVREFVLDRESTGRSSATIRFYWTQLGKLERWLADHGVETIECLNRRHIRGFFAELHSTGLSDHSTAASDRAVRAFCTFCVREGWIEDDPMAGRPREAPPHDMPKTLSILEIQRLLATCDDSPLGWRDRALMLTLLDTGMRAGEVVNMKMDDLRLEGDRGQISIPGTGTKGRNARTVCVWAETVDALEIWLDKRPPQAETVFVASTGWSLSLDPLTTSGLNQAMRRRAKLAGVRGKARWCHIWRHTFAKAYIKAGGDLETLRRLLGHSSLATVQIYLGFSTEDLMDRHFELSPVRAVFED